MLESEDVMKDITAFVKEFRVGTTYTPLPANCDSTMVAGFYGHTYLMLAVLPDRVELACIHTAAARRGNGCARRALGLLVMLAVKHRVCIQVRRVAPFDNGPMDAVQLARWFFRRDLRVVGMA